LTHIRINIDENLVKRRFISTLRNYEIYLENLVINVMPISHPCGGYPKLISLK